MQKRPSSCPPAADPSAAFCLLVRPLRGVGGEAPHSSEMGRFPQQQPLIPTSHILLRNWKVRVRDWVEG